MDDILSQIIAYAPDKIDTELKARALVQAPRNMKLAQVPRSEMDNFNTPDLDQGADSILRPGETLEDFDVEFRRPNAQGGVQQLVQPNADGSRPGYNGNKFLEEGKKSRFSANVETIIIDGKEFRKITKKGNPNFGKYLYRTSKAGKEVAEYLTKSQLEKRVANPQVGKSPFIPSKGYAAELEDIKKFVLDKGGAKKLYLSDLVEEFGDTTKVPEGDVPRDPNTERKIKIALGDKDYAKLIQGGKRLKTKKERIITYNKLVRDVNRGDRPLIDLSSDKISVNSKDFTNELKPVELEMYKKMSPKLKSIVARITQPRKRYTADDIKNISETTNKTFDKMKKNYPLATAERTSMLKAGARFFDDKSYILAQIDRHILQNGNKFKYISGDKISNIKYKDLNTGKIISYNKMDLNDPMFEEIKNKYKEIEKIKKTKIDNPLKPGEKITINAALKQNGDYLVLDHLGNVGDKPLNNLTISTQKTNMSGQIKNLTAEEIKSTGRNLDLSFEDNIKRYSKYARNVLLKKAGDPNFKVPTPTETIVKKTGTFKGVGGTFNKLLGKFEAHPGGCGKAAGGRILFAEGTSDGKITTCARKVSKHL